MSVRKYDVISTLATPWAIGFVLIAKSLTSKHRKISILIYTIESEEKNKEFSDTVSLKITSQFTEFLRYVK